MKTNKFFKETSKVQKISQISIEFHLQFCTQKNSIFFRRKENFVKAKKLFRCVLHQLMRIIHNTYETL